MAFGQKLIEPGESNTRLHCLVRVLKGRPVPVGVRYATLMLCTGGYLCPSS